MPTPPHNFPSLRSDGPTPTLVLGAGASAQIAPLPFQLLKEIQPLRNNIESELNCTSTSTLTETKHLYEWADDLLMQLKDKTPHPKLRLAGALGITRDSRWLGEQPLRGSTPRHRAIARLARERRWYAIWSLNWDAVLECALERVGFNARKENLRVPWPSHYLVYSSPKRFVVPGNVNTTLVIYKPHGCIRSILDAERDLASGNTPSDPEFKIGAKELASLSENHATLVRICKLFTDRPMVTLGWSASEKYMLDALQEVKDADGLLQTPIQIDALSIVDISFGENHSQLANMYGSTTEQAFVEVAPENYYTSDDLFLWLQTLFAIERLKHSAPENCQDIIETCETELAVAPLKTDFPGLWVDNFLPTWIRLCWRAGLVKCRLNGGGIVSPSDISCDLRDEHIPLFLPNIERPDLVSASILLCTLLQSTRDWDFYTYPGAFWNRNAGRLVIPLPCWVDSEDTLDLRAIKPLFEDILKGGIGNISVIEILPIGQATDFLPSPIQILKIKQSVCRQMTLKAFAIPERIGIIGLDAL